MVRHLEILNCGGRRIRFAYPGKEAWKDKVATLYYLRVILGEGGVLQISEGT